MSVEKQLSDVVQACNALTKVVNNKVSEIDKALSQAVAEIPKVVRAEGRKRLYIDQVNGSDDNDGLALSRPLRSLARAGSLTIPGGACELYLLNDYEFLTSEGRSIFYSADVQVRSADVYNPVTIKFNAYKLEKYIDQYFMASFQFYQSGTIEFYRINLELPSIPDDHGPGKYYPHGASVVRSNSTGIVVMPLSVRLSEVKIIVPDEAVNEFHFIGNPSGITNLALYACTMPSAWKDRNKMFHQGKLSNTIIGKRIINSDRAMSTDLNVENTGRVE
ncbi:MAG: hypothetical protein K0U59_02885 [Gammaproteobacteria bacterium]|nr:hypothetical protein [Gammaproteobacteria bacterium]